MVRVRLIPGLAARVRAARAPAIRDLAGQRAVTSGNVVGLISPWLVSVPVSRVVAGMAAVPIVAVRGRAIAAAADPAMAARGPPTRVVAMAVATAVASSMAVTAVTWRGPLGMMARAFSTTSSTPSACTPAHRGRPRRSSWSVHVSAKAGPAARYTRPSRPSPSHPAPSHLVTDSAIVGPPLPAFPRRSLSPPPSAHHSRPLPAQSRHTSNNAGRLRSIRNTGAAFHLVIFGSAVSNRT